MGLTDLFTVKYKDVKAAYRRLYEHLDSKAGSKELRDQAIVNALRETVLAMDKGLQDIMSDDKSSIQYGDPSTGREAHGSPKKYFDSLLTKMSEELKKEMYSKMRETYGQADPETARVTKGAFKERKYGLADYLPNFFKNLCRELDKFRRKCLGKPLKPGQSLEDTAEKMVKEMNRTMKRDIASQAKKTLIDGVKSVGNSVKGLFSRH